MAYSNWRSCGCSPERAGRPSWGARAIELAERLGETEILVHALNNVGTRRAAAPVTREGAPKLERSLALALDAGLEEHVGARVHEPRRASRRRRATTTLADGYLEAGLAYCASATSTRGWLYMPAGGRGSSSSRAAGTTPATSATRVLRTRRWRRASRITR